VLKLIKASLSDDLVITTINASPRTCDTSANGLVPATAPAAGGATFIGRQPAGGAAPAAAGAHRRPPEVAA